MISRYDERMLLINSHKMYRRVLEDRGVRRINQYETAKYKYPTASDIRAMTTVSHVWKYGDRFYKLANKFYGRSEYWWIIAFFNQVPTESHLQLGDVIDIPLDYDEVMRIMGV